MPLRQSALPLSDRYSDWFPLAGARRTRDGNMYRTGRKEDIARCDHLYNSPIFYMRRRLNGKEGKKYGQYRED